MIKPSWPAVFALKFLQKSMMLTPCGPSAVPTGGAGVALPAAIWSFTIACTFFAITLSLSHRYDRHGATNSFKKKTVASSRLGGGSDFLHLQKVELDGRCAAEDRDHDLQRVLVEVDLVDHAVEAGERPFVDPHLLALFEHV